MSLVFIRSPKVLGSSVHQQMEHTLGKAFWAAPMGSSQLDAGQFRRMLNAKKVIVVWPEQVRWLQRQFLKELKAKKHPIVTAIRHPWDRFISSWAFARRRGWIGEDSKPLDLITKRHKLNGATRWHTFREQTNQLYFKGKLVPDFTMRTEHIQEDFAVMCEMIGLPELLLRQTNVSKHRPWREYYDEEPALRDAVASALPLDTTHLPYEFDSDKPTGPLPETLVSSAPED